MKRHTVNNKGGKSGHVTESILKGSIYVAVVLTSLLFVYDLTNGTQFRIRFWIACSGLLYLLLSLHLLKRGFLALASWLVIIFYELLAALVLTTWGLTSTTGMLTACFALLLPGILMRPQKILPVTILTLLMITGVYLVHVLGIVKPIIYIPSEAASVYDLIAYLTILSIFALVSWISASQSAVSLTRALAAESRLHKQKKSLAVQLKDESRRLAEVQAQQIKELYRFAVIGQSATATLHELANHLSVVSLDIENLKNQHKSSIAISNAEEGIAYINSMVRKARTQLNNAHDLPKKFDIIMLIDELGKEFAPKLSNKGIRLSLVSPNALKKCTVNGSSAYLTQCMSVLINNAVDACAGIVDASITIQLSKARHNVSLSITDNGIGIPAELANHLFEPIKSTKASGLGVGLYITKHLIESYFGGTLQYVARKKGACFKITIPQGKRSPTYSVEQV